MENTLSYRTTFGKARQVRSKGRRLKKPLRHALSAMSGARAFSTVGAEAADKRLSGELTAREQSEVEKLHDEQQKNNALKELGNEEEED